jgi:putative addiction module component (TIGR02574 family)
MSIDELLALPPAEQLRIIGILWDKLSESKEPIPLSEWIEEEAIRRRDEMKQDPTLGLSYEEVWNRIEQRHG